MSTTNFVVRDVAGNVQRGTVGDGGLGAVSVAPGQAISLNLSPSQILSYERDGANLKVVLADGSVLVVEGVFTATGEQQADVYISADGALQRVALHADGDHTLIPNYTESSVFGKWSPDDDLFFVRGNDTAFADAQVIAPAEGGDVGMLATTLLGGFGALGGGSALAAGGAALAGAALLGGAGGGGGGATPVANVAITSGTKGAGVLVNAADHADGVTVGGAGTPGGVVTVSIGGVTHQTTVGADGTWSQTFAANEVAGGTYETPVNVTISANGVTGSATDMLALDTETSVTVNTRTVETDGVVSHAEHQDGITLTGTAEPGASVVVTMNGFSRTVTADASGDWSADFTRAEVPSGEIAAVPVTVVATDIHGNSATANGTFEVDTVTTVSVNTATLETDGVVSGAERQDGITLTGTAEPDASVVVTMNGFSRTVTADANGDWSADFTRAEVPSGEIAAVPVTVVATDIHGNSATANGTFEVDTVTTVSVNAATVETDGIVSGAERQDGITLTGTAEPGASVVVTMNGFSRTVTADGNGDWSANYARAEVPSGEIAAVPVTAVATDAHGNSATSTGSFRVDTLVNDLRITPDFTGGDAKVNLAEVAGGLDLGGTVEVGSTVQVVFNGTTYNATVTGTSWSLTIPEADIPAMEGPASVVVNATDAVGNTASVTQSFTMDTTAPDIIDTEGMLDVGTIAAVQLGPVDGALSVHQVDVQGPGAGTVTQVTTAGAGPLYAFGSNVPDGHDLIVTATETSSGNSSSTLFIANDSGAQTVVVDPAALSNFEIKKIDLDLADSSTLTLTAQQVADLAETSDTLYIDANLAAGGGADDTVNLIGAQRDVTKDKIEGGRSYEAFDFGNDIVVYVDENANTVT